MRDLSRGWRADGETVGLVPTMGALHAGHLSLVARACEENARVVVSIFVNPLQFGPREDLARYPRPIESDVSLLREAGVDAIYMPSVETMYPRGASTRVVVSGVAEPLEGAARPGHFDGVTTVVAKLFGATEPDCAYFGQKDAQQVAVVKRMARDLDLGVEIRVCPTVREPDGLALSSRNAYLDPAQRKAATILSRALSAAAEAYQGGEHDPARLKATLHELLATEPTAEVEYAELVDPETFRPAGTLAVLAVRIGGGRQAPEARTRLIDNLDLREPYPG